jgi:pimeloyl-ACP methyl ester carboxylesterase
MSLRLILLILWMCSYPLLLSAQDTPYSITDIYSIKEANGLTLAIRRVGAFRTHPEARAILLVHGGGSGGVASFDFGLGSFADSLVAKGFVVYLMNIRGWEESTAPLYNENDTSLTAGSCVEAAEDIDAVVEHIRQREHILRVSLFGWAAGGHWAAYYTTLHNDKVDHLVVLNTLYGVDAPWSYSSAFADPSDSNRYDSRIPIYRISDTKSIIASRLASIPSPDKTPWVDSADLESYAWSVINDSEHLRLKVPGGYRKESFYMAHGHQYWNASDIRVPTLIVRSQFDQWSRPVDVSTLYHDLVNAPRRKAVELPNATHFVTIDKPRQGRNSLVAAIDRFIAAPAPWTMTIDSLTTDEQTLTFMRAFDGLCAGLYIDPPAPTDYGPRSDLPWRRKFGARTWEKGDFDGNGKTDLLFNGYYSISGNGNYAVRICLVVLDLGRDNFRIVQLSLGDFIRFFAAKKLSIRNQDYIVTLQYKESRGRYNPADSLPNRIDTLAYRLGHFIERPKPRKPHSIKELTFSIGGGLTTDLGYTIRIRGDSALLLQEKFNDSATDIIGYKFVAPLNTTASRNLYQLLRYIDIPSLKSNYSVSWTDDRTASLCIRFDKGRVKSIEDYGEIGTYGLVALYDLFETFRRTLPWTRISSR